MEKRRTVHQVRQVCRACSRLHTTRSRHGIYFHCQWCGALNAGPRLIAEYGMVAPPARGRQVRGVGAASAADAAPPRRARSFLEVMRGGAA